MVIGFGTGTTAGAVAEHADVEHLEVVEVSSAVLGLAPYFCEANRRVLDDERVEVVRDDGRNGLLLHEADLDVITLEPLMPYSPPGYPFYTREFYELARDRLTEGGVLCQWVPVHAMPVGLYAAFVRAFFEVFPEGSLWFFEQSTALIGRKGTAAPDRATVRRRLYAVADDLREAGFEDPELVGSGYVARGVDVLRLPPPPEFERYAGRPVVDMDPYAEFEPTPRAPLNTPYLHQTLQYLFSLVEPEKVPADEAWWFGGADRKATQLALAARWKEAEADFLGVGLRGGTRGHRAFEERTALRARALEDAAMGYRSALEQVPGERVLQWRLVRAWRKLARVRVLDLLARAKAARRADRPAEREETLRLAEGVAQAALPPALGDPDPVATERIDAAALHVSVLLRLGRCAEAERVLRAAREDLADERREARLVRLLAGLDAHREQREVAAAAEDAYVFEDAAPCREEGTAPVREEVAEYEAALAGASPRALRSAARRLEEAARRQGCVEAVLEVRRAAPVPATPQARAVDAALRGLLDRDDARLGDLLEDKDAGLARTALIEAGWWDLLHRYPGVLDRAAADAQAATRKALATAAAAKGRPEVLRRVVDLLMDAEEDVRAEAFSVFLKHRPDLIEGYDPRAAEEERRAACERVKAALR